MPEIPDKTVVLPAPAGEQEKLSAPERRDETRYPFIAEAEIIERHSQARVTGRCSDLSPGGCYVDTLTPFAVGAEVRVSLTRDGQAFEAAAVVTYAQNSLGVGLKFTEIARGPQAVLDSWIEELSGGRTSANAKPATSPAGAESEGPTNRLIVLNELISLLVRRKILTEAEAAAFRRKMFS